MIKLYEKNLAKIYNYFYWLLIIQKSAIAAMHGPYILVRFDD